MRRSGRFILAVCALLAAVTPAVAQAPQRQARVAFRVRYVADGGVYVDAGRNDGVTEGMELVIKAPTSAAPGSANAGDDGIVARLKIIAVADTSAVCEVESSHRPIVVGDIASLPDQEVEAMVQKNALSSTRKYPAIVSFTDGDALDEEARADVPTPPLPEINEARGRIGFDYSGLYSSGQFHATSSELGVVLQADITRINGTYWNLSGYWRGRLESRSSVAQPTLQDLINRTYHMSLTYANPNSPWVMGFGRMYLPWASSLDTIDGGYFGRRLSDRVTAGIFAGSTPDPTSWSYNPNRRIAGSFINVTGGDYDQVHYSSTFGLGVSTLGWRIDRPFVFGENEVSYKRVLAVYHSFQIDQPHAVAPMPAVPAGLSRSFLTLRIQPHPRVSFDINHNYFRDVPTYDLQLVGTGLLDKVLFQGISVGTRVELPRHVTVYTMVGRSDRSGDAKSSWNTMYGVTMDRIWRTGLRADVRFASFNSPFAQGSYRSFGLTRNLGERVTGEVLIGTQSFVSAFSRDNGSHFLNAHADVNLGPHYFFEGGFTVAHGALQNYTQWYTMLGYRFDNRERRKETANGQPH